MNKDRVKKYLLENLSEVGLELWTKLPGDVKEEMLGELAPYVAWKLQRQEKGSGFGKGFEVWEDRGYYIGDRPSAAQYISPFRATGNVKLVDRYHYNLCGQLCVAFALGLNVREGLKSFAGIRDYAQRIINNPSKTTHAAELGRFLNVAGLGRYEEAVLMRNDSGLNTPEKLKKHTDAGDIVIALVNIDGNRKGEVRSMETSGRDIAHWVWVQAVHISQIDLHTVTVYNPYLNQMELYGIEEFLGAHKNTPGNSSIYLSVVARKKE